MSESGRKIHSQARILLAKKNAKRTLSKRNESNQGNKNNNAVCNLKQQLLSERKHGMS